MSADYVSICAVLPPETAHRIHRELSSREWRGPLVGPRSEKLFDFSPNARPDWARIAAAYRSKRPPVDGLEGSYVEIGVGTMEAIAEEAGGACEMATSSGIASLAVVDRVLGIPRGNPILGGHAVVRVSQRHRSAFTRAWNSLLDDAGGPKRAASSITPYLARWGNGREEAARIFDAMARTISRADDESSLVFVCAPVP